MSHRPKDTTWDIEEICIFDVSEIKKEVQKFSKEWFFDTSRQEMFPAHKDTMMFQLRYFDYEWERGQKAEWKDVYSLSNKDAVDQLNNIYDTLGEKYDGKVVRSELISMKRKTSIPRHTDKGDMLITCRRLHIPIITDDDVWFSVLSKRINMKEGVCYEINNLAAHSVENNSNIDRIHLIVDIIPNEYLDA
ncbi:MAG: hypothetical protein RLZZ328_1371 [Bacteroidota bacterium]|jgi:hypothetical protein